MDVDQSRDQSKSFGKVRTLNWTAKEIEVLREECTRHSQILHGSFTTNITLEKKNRTWRDITDKINAVCGGFRTCEQAKKKWKNMRTKSAQTVRQYSSCMKKTGL